jgi:hypothetical protein
MLERYSPGDAFWLARKVTDVRFGWLRGSPSLKVPRWQNQVAPGDSCYIVATGLTCASAVKIIPRDVDNRIALSAANSELVCLVNVQPIDGIDRDRRA